MLTSAPALLALISLSTAPCVEVLGDSAARGGRPTLSGSEEVIRSADGFFALHYTSEGPDRVQSVEDLDGNGLADVLDGVLEDLEVARSFYLDRGYRPLVRDAGGGGGVEP